MVDVAPLDWVTLAESSPESSPLAVWSMSDVEPLDCETLADKPTAFCPDAV